LCYVRLPFNGGCGDSFESILKFSKENGFELNIVDARKGRSFRDYIQLVRAPEYGYGKYINPCKDCKVFIFKEGKKIAKKIGADIIANGETLGQRPMSQMKKHLLLTEEKSGLKGKILRPLSGKLLPETVYEKNGLISRDSLYEFQGRQRKAQLELAKRYGIEYPEPAGGCLLCDKKYGEKLKLLLNKTKFVKYEEILLLNRSRMFSKRDLIYVGREKNENLFILELNKKLKYFSYFKRDEPGPTIIYRNKKDLEFVKEVWEAYSSKKSYLKSKVNKFLV
jgi:tRNA-uridine 2-sulfurtransferase